MKTKLSKVTVLLLLLLAAATLLAACADGSTSTSEPPSSQPPSSEPPPSTAVNTPKPPAEDYIVDFADGKAGFLLLNTGSVGTDQSATMDVVDLDGGKAVRLTMPTGGALRVGVNVDGLLGSRATDVRTAVFEVFTEYPDGSFSAVEGRVASFKGSLDSAVRSDWTVYLASRNPNSAVINIPDDHAFISGGPNMFEFSVTVNGPYTRGETPAIIYIKSIAFYDSKNEAIPVDTDAGWAGPAGYGEPPKLVEVILDVPPDNIMQNDAFYQWLTTGTDNKETNLTWEVLKTAVEIILEIPAMPEGGDFTFLIGGPNDALMELVSKGWSGDNKWWIQKDNAGTWADGKYTIRFADLQFEASMFSTDDSGAAKFAIGIWNTPFADLGVTKITLLCVEPEPGS